MLTMMGAAVLFLTAAVTKIETAADGENSATEFTGCIVNSMTRLLPTSRCGDVNMSPPAVTHVVTGHEESVQVVVRWKGDERSDVPPTNATVVTGRVHITGAPPWIEMEWQQVGYVWVNAPMGPFSRMGRPTCPEGSLTPEGI
jgi:hypothetical protein